MPSHDTPDERPVFDLNEVLREKFSKGEGVICLQDDMSDEALATIVKHAASFGRPFTVIPPNKSFVYQDGMPDPNQIRHLQELLEQGDRGSYIGVIVPVAQEVGLKHSLIMGSTARGTAAIGIDDPSIEAIKALDGKMFAMLTEDEKATLGFFRAQGRKYGVSITIINQADPVKLAATKSRQEADQILMSANSRVQVRCSRFFQVERQDERGQWNRMASTEDPKQALDLLTDKYRRVIELSSGLEVDREQLINMAAGVEI